MYKNVSCHPGGDEPASWVGGRPKVSMLVFRGVRYAICYWNFSFPTNSWRVESPDDESLTKWGAPIY